jgi:hypothetical protein
VEWLSRDSLVLATLPAFRADCPSRCSNTTPATSATPVSLSSLPLLFLSRSEGFKNAFRLLVAEVRRDCGLSDDYNNAPASSYQPVSADSIVVSPLPPSLSPPSPHSDHIHSDLAREGDQRPMRRLPDHRLRPSGRPPLSRHRLPSRHSVAHPPVGRCRRRGRESSAEGGAL